MPYTRCKTRTVRKQHQCALCLRQIEIGERCICLDQFDNGTAWTNYMHVHCSNFHEEARDERDCLYCESGCETCFEQEIMEHICNGCDYKNTAWCVTRPIKCRRVPEILKENYGEKQQ